MIYKPSVLNIWMKDKGVAKKWIRGLSSYRFIKSNRFTEDIEKIISILDQKIEKDTVWGGSLS